MVFFSTFVNFVPDLCVIVGGSSRLPLGQERDSCFYEHIIVIL